jgi:hypothetical protein
LLERIQRVHDFRISQIEDGKKFQSAYNKLLRAYRQLVAASGQRVMPTPQEQALLDKQQHYDFGELSQGEQQKLKGELDSMWEQIPTHLQEKARNLAGVN